MTEDVHLETEIAFWDFKKLKTIFNFKILSSSEDWRPITLSLQNEVIELFVNWIGLVWLKSIEEFINWVIFLLKGGSNL